MAFSFMKSNKLEQVPDSMLYSKRNVEAIELVRYVPKNRLQSQPEVGCIQHDTLWPKSGKTGNNQEAPKPENVQKELSNFNG